MREVRSARGTAARLAGRRAEVLAAMWLMAKGYRILGFRLKTRQAEIDLLPAGDACVPAQPHPSPLHHLRGGSELSGRSSASGCT